LALDSRIAFQRLVAADLGVGALMVANMGDEYMTVVRTAERKEESSEESQEEDEEPLQLKTAVISSHGEANVVLADVQVEDGVIHVLDRVI